ncbi:MAG: hypothetical protein Ct9H300mP23_04530 [Nitrospinota bacterium]|nr:MAG: hypothetical protein Ct9H300mP23_04530 [Nitrospinota bacterium]
MLRGPPPERKEVYEISGQTRVSPFWLMVIRFGRRVRNHDYLKKTYPVNSYFHILKVTHGIMAKTTSQSAVKVKDLPFIPESKEYREKLEQVRENYPIRINPIFWIKSKVLTTHYGDKWSQPLKNWTISFKRI